MIEIKNKEEVLKRVNELYRKPGCRLSCPFCKADSRNFTIGQFLVEIDKQAFVQFFCNKCGYSMLLNYNVLMGKEGGSNETEKL